MSKVSNVLLMIQYLSTGKKYNINELSELLEVSPRMIRVYKNELELAGIYIRTLKGPYGGYVLEQNIRIPQRFIVPKDINIENKNVFNTINVAIKEKRKCTIEYQTKDKKIKKRTIHPYDLILFGNEWGVAAYCELKEEIRHFYLNRIISIKIINKYFN
ncbi:MAG: WYL domain-containing protein [Mycoplasmatota bacterium]